MHMVIIKYRKRVWSKGRGQLRVKKGVVKMEPKKGVVN